MLAFTNTEVTKAQLIESLERHAAADRIIAGQYWTSRGGCAVGCSIHDFRPGSESIHKLYEPLFGVPQIIARLEDSIFERLPYTEQKAWPLRFANAIREGSDLSGVWYRFALWMLVDPDAGAMKFAKSNNTREAIKAVGALYQRKCNGDSPSRKEWADAAASAASAAYYAYYTDAAAAVYADAAAAVYAAYYAAYADAVTDAAADAAAAATSAYAAYYANAANAAASAVARRVSSMRQANKLIELFESI